MFARFLLVSCCLGAQTCGWVRLANADRPDPSYRCTYGPDGKCIPNSREYGYYPTHWRRWPGNAELAWEEPKAPPKKAAPRKKPAEQLEEESSTEGTRGKKAPTPAPEETSLEPELPPKTPRAMPDEDQPPRPPAPELPPTLPAPALPPLPGTEKSPPAAPRLPEPEPARAPAPAMQGELPQPSVDQDLRNLLPEDNKPPKKGPPKSPNKSNAPPVPPPQLREDPFRDDPLPSEAPATPKSSKQTPGPAPADASRLTRTGTSRMQWRPGGPPAAAATLHPAAAELKLLPETQTLEVVEVGSADRTSFESGAEEPLNPLRRTPRRATPLSELPEAVPTTNWGIAAPAVLISGSGSTQNPLR